MNASELRSYIREVPDYPKPGILFKDITPLLGDARAFSAACREMAARYRSEGITHVVSIESRGFLFGAPVAIELGSGLVPVRKRGKLPSQTVRQEYALEYGTDVLEMHVDAVGAASRVVIVDDVLATGGTAIATQRLVEGQGATVVGFLFLVELEFLEGRARLERRVESIIGY